MPHQRARVRSGLEESHLLIFSPSLLWVEARYRRGTDGQVTEFEEMTAKGKQMSSEKWEMGDSEAVL